MGGMREEADTDGEGASDGVPCCVLVAAVESDAQRCILVLLISCNDDEDDDDEADDEGAAQPCRPRPKLLYKSGMPL